MSMLIKLKYGNTNTFFIRGMRGNLLVDTDYAGTLPAFYRAIKEQEIKISDITYVLATHYHPDHIGLVSELIHHGVKLADTIFGRDKSLANEPFSTDHATIISTEESRAFLKSLGIEGEIVRTTSHSADSISLILDDGECFVGDLEPIEYLTAYDRNDALKYDWELIMRYAPKTIFYAHANEKHCS